jgi:NAD(P)-dependent dehydrogenase (short-subunit alcohol dehydrogenase family)
MDELRLDHSGTVLLVTGGTRGIGLATALAFARHGARAVLTYRWGSADEGELAEAFRRVGAPEPWLLEADVGNAKETDSVVQAIRERYGRVDVFVSNAVTSLLVNGVEDYAERGFLQSLGAGAWPTFEYLGAMHRHLGRYPRYVVAMSSDGAEHYTDRYDFIAASKAVLETLCRYYQHRLLDEPVNINVLRSRMVPTDSFRAVFGDGFEEAVRREAGDRFVMTPEEVAEAALALCSGFFDGVRGQVITVDRGSAFADGISYMYERQRIGAEE